MAFKSLAEAPHGFIPSAFSMNRPESRYPPAPELRGELLLDVFTHRSLRQEGGGSKDNERYAVLGAAVLEASITHCVFQCHPHFGRGEMEEERARLLADQNIEQWTKYYRFRDKLRYNASAHEEVNSPEGAREIFYAYVGGLYTQANGPSTVNSWVYKLVVPPQDRIQTDQVQTPLYHLTQPPPPSVPYPMPPPPPPLPPPQQPDTPFPPRSRTNSLSSTRYAPMVIDEPFEGAPPAMASTGKSFLPRFNEITTRRRFTVQWPAEQRGLQHAPRWVVKCVVDGKEVGEGAATTKQLAKEEAAKQAFYALNLSWP